MESEKICAVCKVKASQKCSACENVYYCNKKHQRSHWKKHAEACRSFKLAVSPRLGRYYVATRNIKMGEIVLKDDQPLVAGPMSNSVPVCLGCYVVLSARTAVPCAKCGWPLCQSCKEHGLECEFTCSRRDSKVQITDYGFPHPSYQCINVIRALSLKDKNPEAYKKLLSFEGHCDLLQKQGNLIFGEPKTVVNFIKRFFKVDDTSEEEIGKIFGVLQVNGHEVPVTEPPYVAVYELATFLEHSCRANCSKSFTSNGGLIVHAASPITKGDHISICYTDPLWGVTNRRHHLSQTKFFDCICERCSDPTEYGTMFNAIKCIKSGCSGFILPETFLDEKNSDYVCNLCGSRSTHEVVEEILEKIGKDISKMRKNDVAECKKFLNQYKTILHWNHYYNVDVSLALAQLIGQDFGGLQAVDGDLLAEKIGLCKRLNDLLATLAPAENRIRGLILFEMHAALAEFSRREREEVTLGLLMESRKSLIEAHRLLQREPEILPEGKIALRAEKNLQDISALFKTLGLSF